MGERHANMGFQGLKLNRKLFKYGAKFHIYESSAVYQVGGEVVLEVIALLLWRGWFLGGVTRCALECDM